MREEVDAIRDHYNLDPAREWNRLQKFHPYEKYITCHMMDRYVKDGDKILDIGGGPGHYSIYYAGKGHDVTLIDLSDENVKFAKKKARQYKVKMRAEQGDALDMSRFEDDSFDIVFLMGPLYHLMNEESRVRAINEAKRVLKPGGYLFSSFILMFGGVIFGLREVPDTIVVPEEQVYYETAANRTDCSIKAFTYAYMTTVKDARRLMESVSGLQIDTVFGQESILSPYRAKLAACSKKVRQAWYDYGLRFCEYEDYLTHTEHLMIVTHKI